MRANPSSESSLEGPNIFSYVPRLFGFVILFLGDTTFELFVKSHLEFFSETSGIASDR